MKDVRDKKPMGDRRQFSAVPPSSPAVLLLLIIGIDFAAGHNPWEQFRNLSGCHLGDHRPGLPAVKCYLHRFGYLPTTAGNDSDEFDDSLRSALLAYQHHFHLNATGTLDLPTIDLMVRPRCGVADVVNRTSTTARGRNLYTYFPGKPRWRRTNLTYFFSVSGVAINESTARATFARAFARWSEVTTLSFTETSSSFYADIIIEFFSGDHGDQNPFDGRLGTLAHAFSPENGRFHLDADERWAAIADNAAPPELFRWRDAVDLESVAVHEIGHLLGLGHSSEESAIMYSSIRTATRKVTLADDDIRGIQSLYGRNPNYGGGTGNRTTPPRPRTPTMMDREGGGVPVGRAREGLVVGIACLLALATLLFGV